MANLRITRAHDVAARLERVLAAPWGELVAEFGVPAMRTALSRGLITRVLHGIYAKAGTEADLRVRSRALAIWATPHGAVTGLAAAHLWRITDTEPRRVTIQVPPTWNLALPPWARALHVHSADVKYRLDGIRTVEPAAAVVQAWREARSDVAVALVIAAVVDRGIAVGELRASLARRKRIPRRADLEELLDLVGGTVTSYLEYVAWKKVFPPRLFPGLQWQREVWPRGRHRVMDAFDEEAMIDLEFDGGGTHGGVAGFERDRERDADMRAAGIEPLHFTYRDLTERPEWCRQQYLELRARRLTRSGR